MFGFCEPPRMWQWEGSWYSDGIIYSQFCGKGFSSHGRWARDSIIIKCPFLGMDPSTTYAIALYAFVLCRCAYLYVLVIASYFLLPSLSLLWISGIVYKLCLVLIFFHGWIYFWLSVYTRVCGGEFPFLPLTGGAILVHFVVLRLFSILFYFFHVVYFCFIFSGFCRFLAFLKGLWFEVWIILWISRDFLDWA